MVSSVRVSLPEGLKSGKILLISVEAEVEIRVDSLRNREVEHTRVEGDMEVLLRCGTTIFVLRNEKSTCAKMLGATPLSEQV